MKEQDHALEILIASCDSLARRFEDFSSSPDRMKPWPDPIRRASTLVGEALRSLQKYEGGAPSAMPAGLGSTISRLANRLLGDEGEIDTFEDELAKHERGEPAEGLRGYSWAIAIPDLLGFLKLQDKTGLLTVTLGREVVLIELKRGEVVNAYSDNAPEDSRIGEILIQLGALTRGQLETFMVHQSAADRKRLGEVLEAQGLVTRDELRRGLEAQVQMLFNRLFETENAYFTFVEGRPMGDDGRIRMNVTRLLLESARTQDEKGRDLALKLDAKPIDSDVIGQ